MSKIYPINAAVIQGINVGDESALGLLHDSYYSYLCAYATSFIFDPDQAEDIVNEVFINLWDKRKTLCFPIHNYLLKCVHNGCINHIRMCKKKQLHLDKYQLELLNYQEHFCMQDNNPLSLLEVYELKEQIRGFVSQLPPKCRLIFEQYLYEGKSPKDIAEMMGLNVSTVRVQIKIALDKLKAKLGPLVGMLIFLGW